MSSHPGSPKSRPTEPRRLGLYGGSFDPVHTGHLAVAGRAREAFALDGIWFLPAAIPPHKLDQRLTGGRDRVCMLELALADLPCARVNALELSREGPSYTYDTVAEIARERPPGGSIHLILGGDNLPGLPGWHRAAELLDLVEPIVVRREGDGQDPVGSISNRLAPEHLEKLRRGYMDLPPVPGRASHIREALRKGDPDADRNLSGGVLEYIRRRGLYGLASGAQGDRP
ncbi:MAG: nicotinate (nicotinamide) nucleotide adenylyltransferase [Planctomycetes bacterium]|nr:nicotinate (nicotinamide) nucleotide adenylyltransferase [Planctomycetota bacterium]